MFRKLLVNLVLLLFIGHSTRCCSLPFEDCYTSSTRNALSKEKPITYSQDIFHASDLIGTWQFSHNTIVGTTVLKEVTFFIDNTADIVVNEENSIDRYTKTMQYTYMNKHLKFTDGKITFDFALGNYIYPQLMLLDSFGTYVMTKVN